MSDREKTIKGLEYCSELQTCFGCPYCKGSPTCQDDLCKDALQLIKEQPEIVRCKNCKRAKLIMWGDQENYKCYPPETDDVPEAYLEPECTPWHKGDFYCAYGERKEN